MTNNAFSGAEAFLAEEVAAHEDYLAKERGWQTWNGTEPALQLLCLPSGQVLPEYAERPEYLNPSHCRLCLLPVREEDSADHLRDQHDGMTPQTYRATVLRSTLTHWPQPISPQLLRTRLAAFKNEMTDANFQLDACACCAREKRRCKLQRVCLPSASAASAPDWLQYTDAEWLEFRAEWFNQMDRLLNVEHYLQDVFDADRRVEQAAAEENSYKELENGSEGHAQFRSKAAATSWLRRVQLWRANLLRDLRADSVLAPGSKDLRWLLFFEDATSGGYPPDNTASAYASRDYSREVVSNNLHVALCKHCLAGFSRKDAKGKPKLQMPEQARANGLWGGPESEELRALTYAERKVIQLARVYVSVKRVFLDPRSFAQTARNTTPHYHEKNVVAFPQNPDMVQRLFGLTPTLLADTLTVQFTGGDRSCLRTVPELTVSVDRLRRAFSWLAVNSWPWMTATKYEHIDDVGNIGEIFEKLLESYRASTGTTQGGVPAEILQSATKINASQAVVKLQGPADAVASDEEDDAMLRTTNDKGPQPEDNESAAVIAGGTDDISPLQLWDSIMRQYGVMQRCDEEFAKIRQGGMQTTAAEDLQIERLRAVEATVHALQAITNKDMRAKLDAAAMYLDRGAPDVLVTHRQQFLSNFEADFWASCFLDLFPRGDCQERSPRKKHCPEWKWAKTLVTRVDNRRWRRSHEFVASLYNVRLRRSQIRAVKLFIDTQGPRVEQVLAEITSGHIVAEALNSGECDTLRDVLNKKKLSAKLETMVHSMMTVQRNVRGSEAEKQSLRYKFSALRIWNCFSSLFSR